MKRIILALFLACGVPASAQQLLLPDAISIALHNSLNVRIARNTLTAAHIGDSYGMAGGLPVVNIAVADNIQSTNIDQQYTDVSRNTLRNNVINNNLQGGLAGSILLYNGSRVISAKGRLDIASRQAEEQVVSRTMVVASNVMLRYYDIIRQQSYSATLQKSIDVSQKKLDIIKARQSVGMANNSDLFQAQVDLNTQTLALQSQQLIVAQDKADLLYQLALNPDSAIVIHDTIIVDGGMQLDPLLKSIPANPDIIVAAQQADIARHIQRETAAQMYPSLSLNAGYNLNRSQYAAGFTLVNQQLGPYTGIGLTVPIFNGGIYRRQAAITGINADNALLVKDSLAMNYTAMVVKNWQAYRSNLLQLETARQNFETATKLLDLVLQQFQFRQNTILEVETAQQSYENAANQLVNIEYAAKVAEIVLKRLSNHLDL